jgi:hypothetical protein
MSNCPRCHQSISSKVITCPHCGMVFKAYGHPGITLHRALGDTSLCETCTYHADDSCTFPQRPHAQECTLYNDINQPLESKPIYAPRRNVLQTLSFWYQQNPGLIGLGVLIVASLLLAWLAASR